MAVHNNPETMFYYDDLDKTKNKVYINPNFNRPTGNCSSGSAVMHFNPKFSYLLSNVQNNAHNKPKIYVNPDFMKSKSIVDEKLVTATTTNPIQQKAIGNNTNFLEFHEQPTTIGAEKLPVPVPIAKSRYSLVRQNTTKKLDDPVADKPKHTYQVNKYKSIPLNDIKRSLDNAKNATNKQSTVTSYAQSNHEITTKKYIGSSISDVNRNQFKIVNTVVKSEKIKTRTVVDTNKKIVILNQSRLRKIKGSLKKNNIPCPMFRKFGKCLRKIRGRCEFLHDKKHVSVCRKFIKGLCHDKDCLLSHDLTTKKMPTCYFYLQGSCTKPNCPYLHVKLSEKVKICPDFLKGYCDKGGKCLQRHVNIHAQKKDEHSLRTKSTLKRKYVKVEEKSLDNKAVTVTNDNDKSTVAENNSDCRYYQESKSEENVTDTCEIIKPTRCKLGTLPSFIQL